MGKIFQFMSMAKYAHRQALKLREYRKFYEYMQMVEKKLLGKE